MGKKPYTKHTQRSKSKKKGGRDNRSGQRKEERCYIWAVCSVKCRAWNYEPGEFWQESV